MPIRGRAPKSPAEALSRALSKTLRHAAAAQNIPQDSNGWCGIDDLLSHSVYASKKATPEAIYEVVSQDKKGRFELNADKSMIRAVQGHSVAVDVDLKQLQATDLVSPFIHGTYFDAWEQIRLHGLSRMGRQYIHMASGLLGEAGVISGMRASSQVYIYIDAPKAFADGIPFYQAANGALLSPGRDGVISPEYFAKVVDSKGRDLLSQ